MPPRRPVVRALAAALLGLSLGAGALAALAQPNKGGFAPDPPAVASPRQWVFDVAVKAGATSVEKARAVTLPKPATSPRVVGRFALELYVGRELLDRVRFDVPLLDPPPAEGPSRHTIKKPPRFTAVTTRVTVKMADSPRAAYLVLVDRATGEAQKYAWPPEGDGSLKPWKSSWLVEGDAGAEFADGGARVAAMRDPPDGDAGDAGDAGADAGDAGVDAGDGGDAGPSAVDAGAGAPDAGKK